MADIGGKLDTLVALDSSLTVASGGAWTNGSSKDIGASTSPQPVWIAAQWSITNSGTTDGVVVSESAVLQIVGYIYETFTDTVVVSDSADFVHITGPGTHKARKDYSGRAAAALKKIAFVRINRR